MEKAQEAKRKWFEGDNKEHGTPDDENSRSGTELANSVSKRQEGDPAEAHLKLKKLGKKSMGDPKLNQKIPKNPLCMKNWIIQLHEMEEALFQGVAGEQDVVKANEDPIWKLINV